MEVIFSLKKIHMIDDLTEQIFTYSLKLKRCQVRMMLRMLEFF